MDSSHLLPTPGSWLRQVIPAYEGIIEFSIDVKDTGLDSVSLPRSDKVRQNIRLLKSEGSLPPDKLKALNELYELERGQARTELGPMRGVAPLFNGRSDNDGFPITKDLATRAFIAAIDADTVKSIIAKTGFRPRDQITHLIGETLARVLSPLVVYDRHGDQFLVQGPDPAQFCEAMKKADALFARVRLNVKDLSGHDHVQHGFRVRYGLGTSLAEADKAIEQTPGLILHSNQITSPGVSKSASMNEGPVKMSQHSSQVVGIALYAVAIAIGAGPMHLPYGYYEVLRVLASATYLLCGYAAFAGGAWRTMAVCILIVGIFNPLVPVHVGKLLWACIDGAAAVYLAIIAKHVAARFSPVPAFEVDIKRFLAQLFPAAFLGLVSGVGCVVLVGFAVIFFRLIGLEVHAIGSTLNDVCYSVASAVFTLVLLVDSYRVKETA